MKSIKHLEQKFGNKLFLYLDFDKLLTPSNEWGHDLLYHQP